MHIRLAQRALGGVAFLAFAGAAFAAPNPSGTTVAVIQATNVVGAAGERILEVEAPIFTGDRVNTDTIGEAQLRFRDNTRLVIGPNSSLLIDKFVFSDETTARSVTINAVRGTFRFITGGSPKNAYLIRTPTATMGLRGTQFDFSVGPDGETHLALYGGAVRFCDLKGRCLDLAGRCEVVVARPDEGVRRLQSGGERAALIDASFPYLRSQWRLQAAFRVDTGACSATQANYAGLMPAPTPPAPHCPPSKDYGRPGKNGDHARGAWSGRKGGGDLARGKGKGHGKGTAGLGSRGHGKGGGHGAKGSSGFSGIGTNGWSGRGGQGARGGGRGR